MTASPLPQAPQRDVAGPRRQRQPGSEPADRSRHDARPHGGGVGRRHRGSTASICSCSTRTSSIDAGDDDLKRLADKIRAKRLRRRVARRAGVAADRRRIGDGQRRGAQEFRDAGAEGVRDRAEAARPRHPPVRRGAHRFRGQSRRLGEGSRPATRSRLPTRSARPATSRTSFGERLAAEGEICWGGMHSWKRMVRAAGDGRSPEDARVSGRHGAHAALHDGIQRAGGSPPPRRARLDDRSGARRGAENRDQRAAAVDDRLPRRTERRDRSRARARTTRPGATASRPIRTASSTSSATPACGCATNSGEPTQAFQHICWDGCMFPNATMMQAKTWNDVLRLLIEVRNAHGWDARVPALT